MVQNPPADTPRVSPYLYYEDLEAALGWLAEAFGLRERMRIATPEGPAGHAEMEIGDGVVMLGWPGPDYQGPRRLGNPTHSVHVYVDDVDAHFARARARGAKILEEPADQFYGDRRYGAEDPEGHQWYFAQHVRDVAPEDMRPPE